MNIASIKDKQRIAIIGNEGAYEITKIVLHVLSNVGKSHDFILSSNDYQIGDAAIVITPCDFSNLDEIKFEEFLKFNHHIALIHHVEDEKSKNDHAVEQFIEKYELFADLTPKSGTLLYNKEDNLAVVISEKQREGVSLVEYESLLGTKIDGGFRLEGNLNILTKNKNFLSHAGAAKALLQKISIPSDQIMGAFTTYKDKK
ncbi:MAG: hypothetical protein CMB82_08155 [Flammeovirgaceae bacterium]|nr:hypothetical protein [Flammeovirgaceae bacterium]